MKIAFKIPPASHDFSNLHLLAEAGKEEISFLIFSRSPFELHGFYTYSFNKNLSGSETAAVIREVVKNEAVLQQSYASVNVFYNRKECTLVPAEYFSEGQKHEMLNLLFGEDKSSFCFYEHAKAAGIKTVYRVPSEIHETMRSLFPANIFSHSVSQQLTASGNALHCIVYHNSVKMLLFKEGNIAVIQYAEYSAPADVCWHLLNVCERFEIVPDAVGLILGGMIDEHSNLFKEIYRYFLNVSFLPLPADAIISDKLHEHPHHFYSHLSALAQCV